MMVDPKDVTTIQNGGGISQAEFALFNSNRIQSDLEAMGIKLKLHEDSLKFLKAQKNKLDESILDLQGSNRIVYLYHILSWEKWEVLMFLVFFFGSSYEQT